MLKLEIGKVNNAISSSALNNLLRPEFDSRLQQFSLDMKIIESKIQKSNSEMNALNKDQSKSLSDAIELMNLGLTYIAHPLSSTKSALLSLFPSVSNQILTLIEFRLSPSAEFLCKPAFKILLGQNDRINVRGCRSRTQGKTNYRRARSRAQKSRD